MTNVVQQRYRAHQQEGWPGGLARPNEPHFYHTGTLHVPTNGRKPRPGDALLYDAAQDSYKLPTNAAESAKVCGILAYDQGTVQKSLSTGAPTGLNSEAYVEYEDDAVVKVGVMGTFFVLAGSAMEYDQLVGWDRSDYAWDPLADLTLALTGNTAGNINTGINNLLAAMRRCPIVCVSRAPVPAGELAEIRINGRAY